MKKIILQCVKLLCVLAITVSVIQLCRITLAQKKLTNLYAGMKDLITENGTTEASQSAENDTLILNAKFLALTRKNPDFVGWLTIDGTDIDYPVLQSREEPEFYLRRNFEKQPDRHGSLFLDSACDLSDADNFVVYGHNMLDGTMFAQLSRFADSDFCEAQHLISFDTLHENAVWQVILVFTIPTDQIHTFPYHTITNFSPQSQTAYSYVERGKNSALWYKNTTLDNDTKLLTLSTCEDSLGGGRLVVVAEKIS